MTTLIELQGPEAGTRIPVMQLQAEHAQVSQQPRVRVWALGCTLATALVGSVTLGAAAPAAMAMPLDARTSTPQIRRVSLYADDGIDPSHATDVARSSTRSDVVTTAAAVRQLHDTSGLTWDQLGRVFGVSRRAVHMWAAGKRLNAQNTELLSRLTQLVNSAPGGDPEETRAWLFTPMVNGMTPIEQFLDQYRRPGAPVTGSGYTPAGLLGIDTE